MRRDADEVAYWEVEYILDCYRRGDFAEGYAKSRLLTYTKDGMRADDLVIPPREAEPQRLISLDEVRAEVGRLLAEAGGLDRIPDTNLWGVDLGEDE